jgi:hypothetical protein
VTSHHFALENNLFVGPNPPGPRVVDWAGGIDDGTIDYNGWFPDGTFDFGGSGSWSTFAAMKTAGVFEAHGVLLAPGMFASGLVPPSPGSSGDPTLGGAVVAIYNAAGGGDIATVALPASGWSMLGASGYSFRNSDPAVAISSVKVQSNRLQLKGGRASWTYDLNEPSQRRVALRLALGSARPWCASALAKVSGNPPTSAKGDRSGLFTAQPKMAAPLSCPPTP